MDFENLSRRSFIKRTSALAAGVAAPVLFSGLAIASPGYYEDCYWGPMYYIYEFLGGSPYTYGQCFRAMMCNPDTIYEDGPNSQMIMRYGDVFTCSESCMELDWWFITVPDQTCDVT